MDDFKSTMISNYYADKYASNTELLHLYHQNTKHSKKYLMGNMYRSRKMLNSPNFIMATKNPEKQFPLQRETLLKKPSKNNLQNILNSRRSQVQIPNENSYIDEQTISDLFWSSYGSNTKGTRVVPSGGALYPLEMYAIIFNKTDLLEKGLYHYSPKAHSLQLISQEENVFDLSKYIMMMPNLESPSVVFFTTAIFNRATFKYDTRAYRYILLEAGAAAQNISLMATKYNLVSTFIGGTDDFEVEKMLNIDGNQESLVNCLFITKDMKWS